ncbi:zeta toxin family protein [Sulfurimonas sp. NWX79]|uniref:zeta toxin family protein n=1 Tax=Sulfurimonas sp. NWX79 TaxID=2925412 RepID=UPI003204747F
MKTKQKFEKTAIKYLKENRKDFFNHYISDKFPIDEKITYFTAGPSGAGKTEFIQKFIEFESNLLHLDIDIIRDFFKPVGYDGKNSDIFQKPASWGVQFLFDEAVKYRGLSLVVDSNFSIYKQLKKIC